MRRGGYMAMAMFREFVWEAKAAVILLWATSIFFAVAGLASLFGKTLLGVTPAIGVFGAVSFFCFAHFQYFCKPDVWIPRYWADE